MHPLFLRKIVAGAKTEGGYQFLFVDEPELDFAIVAAAGQPPVRQHHQRPDLTLAACERIIGSSLPSFGHSLILPSLPPLTRRPSASGAGASIKLPWVRTIGSPAPSLGQSLILPSLPPPASRPSASTTRQYTSSITWPSTSEWPCDRITSGGPVNALLTRLDGVCLSRPVALARFQCFPQLKRRHARSHLAAPPPCPSGVPVQLEALRVSYHAEAEPRSVRAAPLAIASQQRPRASNAAIAVPVRVLARRLLAHFLRQQILFRGPADRGGELRTQPQERGAIRNTSVAIRAEIDPSRLARKSILESVGSGVVVD